jgi:hypothetical protein
MTKLTPQDVVSLDRRSFRWRPVRRSATRRTTSHPSRREFLKGTIAVAGAMSVGVLSALPTARPAAADHGDWKIWSGCTGLGSWVNDDDCRGCNQGSVLCCCLSSGYHSYAGCERMHRPDQCRTGGYDGWTWSTSACCLFSSGCGAGCVRGFRNRNWRCSDGYRRDSCSAAWQKSICRYVLNGGTQCGPCAC